MKRRQELIPAAEKDQLEVVQLTIELDVPASHTYMEAQIFTPDSRHLIVHRSAHAHGSDPEDPEHQYLICDLEDGYELTPITDELGATAPAISPDGEFLLYFVDDTAPGEGTLTLKRVRIDGTERETLRVLDGPIPGTDYRLSRPYGLSTISSAGSRIAISGFLGDGRTERAPWGLLVFDIEDDDVRMVLEGPSWCNVHPQYSRSLDAESNHDILVQENHGNRVGADGSLLELVGGDGADIHLIRDDGTDFRNMPWGRDGSEFCQGHQCWRGRSDVAITSTGIGQPREHQLIEGRPTEHAGHVGLNTPNGWRNDLSRGERLITDAGPRDSGGSVYLFDLPREEGGALENSRLVAKPGSSWRKEAHVHPFLSPDGKTGVFNSDESGILQAYMVRGWE